jgi:adenylate kinase
MVNKEALIIVGAPGSGKGTQGEILLEKTGFKGYVMSDLIKAELTPGSPLKEKMDTGALIDDGDIFEIFNKHFGGEDKVLIDGIPRTLDQSYWLYGFLKKRGYEIKVLFLEVDEEKLLDRIIARRFCPVCKRGYNLITKKPKNDSVCDVDGEQLIQRTDDTKEVFTDRLKIYGEIKAAILEVFEGNIVRVNGDQSIEEVAKEVAQKLNL